MSGAYRRLLKEYKQNSDTLNLPDSIISLHPVDETDLFSWTATIHPTKSSNSLYKEGYFQLMIKIPEAYPLEPPKIKFVVDSSSKEEKQLLAQTQRCSKIRISTYVPHCNVDFKTGEICLDILKPDNWSPAWTIQTAVLAILVLLDNQEPDSPLNVDMANLFRLDDKLAISSLINYYIHR